MNPIFEKMLSFFTSIILPLFVGYVLRKFAGVKKEKLDFLLVIQITVLIPVLVLLIFWEMELNKNMLLLPVLGFITPLISGAFGYLFSKNKFKDPLQKGSYIVSSILSNRGTIGGLTMFILFGEAGYAYVNIIILFAVIYVFFITYPIGNYYSSRAITQRQTFKAIIFRKTNLPILGILIGIFLNIFAGERPDFIAPWLNPYAKLIAWIALLPVGASISFNTVKKHIKKVWDISLIKFIIMPIITAAIAYPLIPDTQMATILVLVNTMPVAINSVVVSKLTKLDEDVSVSAFLLTTVIYLFVVFPIFAVIFR